MAGGFECGGCDLSLTRCEKGVGMEEEKMPDRSVGKVRRLESSYDAAVLGTDVILVNSA